MVLTGGESPVAEPTRQWFEVGLACRGVPADDLPFVVVGGRRLVQDRAWHIELSDVVQECRPLQPFEVAFGQTQVEKQLGFRDLGGVLVGDLAFELAGGWTA